MEHHASEDTISVNARRYVTIVTACQFLSPLLESNFIFKKSSNNKVYKSYYVSLIELYISNTNIKYQFINLGQSLVDQIKTESIRRWIERKYNSLLNLIKIGNEMDNIRPFTLDFDGQYQTVKYQQSPTALSIYDLEYTISTLCAFINLHPNLSLEHVTVHHPTPTLSKQYETIYGCEIKQGPYEMGQIEVTAKYPSGSHDCIHHRRANLSINDSSYIQARLKKKYMRKNEHKTYRQSWCTRPRDLVEKLPPMRS